MVKSENLSLTISRVFSKSLLPSWEEIKRRGDRISHLSTLSLTLSHRRERGLRL
jgi:hypothetical protein